MVGDGLIEGGTAAEDGATASSSGQRSQTTGGSVPQQKASSWGSCASDAVKIDNKIIDSIFRMNSGGDDDRWTIMNPTAGHIHLIRRGYYSERRDCQCEVQHIAEGKGATYWECVLRRLTSSLLHFEEKTSAEKIILSYVGKGNAAWLQLYAFMCVDPGGEEPGQRTWTVEPDYQEAEEGPHW